MHSAIKREIEGVKKRRGKKSNELPWKKETVITLLSRSEIPAPGGELCRRTVKGTDGIKVSHYIDFLKSLTRNIHIEYKNSNNNFNTSGKCEKSITPPSPNTERSQEKKENKKSGVSICLTLL